MLSPIPFIDSVYFGPDSVRAAVIEDTAILIFNFTDGDADLGNDPNGANYDVFLKDTKDTARHLEFFFPNIPNELRDPDYGMKGTCQILLPSAFLPPRPDSLHMTTGDTVTFEYYIKDQAGHESNHLTTGRLLIRP